MLYHPSSLLLIAGPCSLETADVCRQVADMLACLQEQYTNLTIVFKGSFDKANRTSISSKRGPGMQEGLKLLQMIQENYGFPVLTDIHTADQAIPVAQVCDVLQIPAFLCRQTDLLVAAAQTGKIVNVKKGQFLSPYEMTYSVQKLEAAGASEIWQTERGFSFGYQNLVADMRSIVIMRQNGHPVIFDASHSVQLPGASGGASGGEKAFIEPLALAACAAGANGLFIETHPNPSQAVSDQQTQIPIADFPALIGRCHAIWSLLQTHYKS